MNLLYTVNPRRRRRKAKGAKSRRRRSAAQRAATRRMLAANRARKGGSVSRRTRRRFRRNPSSAMARARSAFTNLRASNVVGLLQNAAVGGAGAILVDVGMGYAGRFLPAAMSAPLNADGSQNWAYIGTKAALAIGLGAFGRRIPVVGSYAGRLAEGSLTVMAYQVMRPLVPAGIPLGYFNPTPTMRPNVQGVRRYVSRAGTYSALPVRSNSSMGRGATASQVIDITAARRAEG